LNPVAAPGELNCIRPVGVGFASPIMGKRDVIQKNRKYITYLIVVAVAVITDRKFREVWTANFYRATQLC